MTHKTFIKSLWARLSIQQYLQIKFLTEHTMEGSKSFTMKVLLCFGGWDLSHSYACLVRLGRGASLGIQFADKPLWHGLCIAQSAEELPTAAIFVDEGETVSAKALVLVYVCDCTHQGANDDFGVVLEEINLKCQYDSWSNVQWQAHELQKTSEMGPAIMSTYNGKSV